MLAMLMTCTGGPEVLEAREVPLPELPSSHHVRVRLHAAGINPVDTKLRKGGTYYPNRLPAILGCDGAGAIADARRAQTRILEEGARLIEQARLMVHVGHELPLRDAAEAHRQIEAGHSTGKIVLRIE